MPKVIQAVQFVDIQDMNRFAITKLDLLATLAELSTSQNWIQSLNRGNFGVKQSPRNTVRLSRVSR